MTDPGPSKRKREMALMNSVLMGKEQEPAGRDIGRNIKCELKLWSIGNRE